MILGGSTQTIVLELVKFCVLHHSVVESTTICKPNTRMRTKRRLDRWLSIQAFQVWIILLVFFCAPLEVKASLSDRSVASSLGARSLDARSLDAVSLDASSLDAGSEPKASATEVVASEAEDQQLLVKTKGVYPYLPLSRFKEAGGYFFDDHNRLTAALGFAAIVIARTQDEEAQAYFRDQGRIGSMEQIGNEILGTGVPGAILGAGFWILGDLNQSPRASHAGQAQLETLLVTGITTSVLKGVVNRQRPDRSDHFSFPSGHTSTVFATATVLNEFYGWKVGVPAFALGALTGVARISDDRHWLSDTVGGATLALLIGHAFSRAHLERLEEYSDEHSLLSQIKILPMVERAGGGLVLYARF